MSRSRGRADLLSFASMALRLVRAYSRRMEAEGTLDDLRMMLETSEMLEAAVSLAVSNLRETHSWREIGEAIGTSGEAARQRWRPNADADLPEGMGVYALCDELGVRYVGQSTSVVLRILTYRRARAHTATLREWLSTRYDTFTVRVLEECETPQALAEAEERWIRHYAEERYDLLLNFALVDGRGGRRRRPTCPNTEMRWRPDRDLPRRVQCTLSEGHPGPCLRSKTPFGQQPAKSTYSRYRLKRDGLVVTLENAEALGLSRD